MGKPEGKYAWTVTVGTKGQIVIPKEAREVFDIHPGDHLLILAEAKQQIEVEKEDAIRDIRRQVGLLSVEISEKVLRQSLKTDKDQMAMIDRMLDEIQTKL